MPPKEDEVRRPTPEELLVRAKREERKTDGKGRLKVFLGFAAGVGKTYEMLNEANRRKHDRGQDVVIGFVETHGRQGTVSQIGDLEVIPRKNVEYHGVSLEEMDTDAIIARKPQWVVVDELAHSNVPGSKHEKRYEDILELLDSGINVLSAMNVQHLESLNDVIFQITNVKVRETVPDWVLGKADEVITIDITPRSLINRLQRGDVYPAEKVSTALANFFTEGNLSALREIALREVASEVDRSVQSYREDHNVSEPWLTQERIMICISPDQNSERILRRGSRIASRLKADVVAVYVSGTSLRDHQKHTLESDFACAKRLNIRTESIEGTDIALALADYAMKHQVSEIIIGHSERHWVQEFMNGSIINRLIRKVPSIDVLVVANKPEDRSVKAKT